MELPRTIRLLSFPALLAALFLPRPALASASLMIWPMGPVIEPDHAASALWLENHGKEPALMQVRVFGWSQHDGQDDYEEQTEVIPSPPIIRIAPGARQLVRLMDSKPQRPAGETLFRIIIDEIPVAEPAPTPTTTDQAGPAPSGGLRFQIRYSLPLYVYGRQYQTAESRAAVPPLRCTLIQRNGRTFFQIANGGQLHARLAEARFEPAGGPPVPVGKGVLGYVLPGSEMAWPLPPGLTGREQLSLSVNDSSSRTVLHNCAER